MKEFLLIMFSLFSLINTFDTSKMLMIFFTRTGNTGLFANYIKEKMNIESYQIVPVDPYTDNIDKMLELARVERNNNIRPKIKDPLSDISRYDTILLGYPLWHTYLPNIVINQIEKLNFEGKTIYPFNTYGTLGVGNSTIDIKNYAKGAIVKEGFPISDNMIKIKSDSMKNIENWINKNFENPQESNSSDLNLPNSTKILSINLFLLFITLNEYI